MKELFSGHGWRVTLDEAALPDGRMKKAARVHSADTVVILPLVQPDRVVILREFRPFWGCYVWMLPSGKADKETDILAAAQRELREETGMRAGKITPYGTCYYRDTIAYTCHFFLAEDLVADPLPRDATELMEVHTLPIDEAIQRVVTGERSHAASGNLLLRYAREHGF
ncbi:MAG: NUDIX hydrolase [Candidatus Peribacteraceae bacterium]|nr:NUDIX hydrolase [Candidatus Peribacteraceae bacterium]